MVLREDMSVLLVCLYCVKGFFRILVKWKRC